MHGILNHLLLTDKAWLGRFTGEPFVVQSARSRKFCADWNELRRQRIETDNAIDNWLNSITDEQLQAPFTFTPISNPTTRTQTLWILAAHLFNHQTHHRGQLTTVMEQLGYDSGATDLPLLPDLQPKTS